MVLRALIAERVVGGQGRVCRSWIGIDHRQPAYLVIASEAKQSRAE
jgi:hypothetical protein